MEKDFSFWIYVYKTTQTVKVQTSNSENTHEKEVIIISIVCPQIGSHSLAARESTLLNNRCGVKKRSAKCR